ncbi:MAG: DNA polymerase III subunit delta [Bacilli bacterium]|nr:DNA polymerase III subunit delta [Bacilli bacterium]
MKNNLFLLIGEDKKLIDFSLYEILNNIEYDENNKILYDMDTCSFTDIIEEASTISLFSNKKVIIVNNFNLDSVNSFEIEYLEKYINSNNQDVYIILISDKVDGRKKEFKIFKDNFKIIELEKVDSDSIYDYVNNKINERGYKIDNINIEYFISKVGNDINNINNELEKLFIYKEEDKKILKSDIDLLTFNNIDNVIYEFSNAILDNDYDKVKSMYDKFMLDNITIDYLIATLAGSFRTSLIIKLLSNKNMYNKDIAKIIGKKEFFVKKSLDRLYRYTVDDLKNYIKKLALIDRDIKSGYDNVGKFELFLFSKES